MSCEEILTPLYAENIDNKLKILFGLTYVDLSKKISLPSMLILEIFFEKFYLAEIP